MNRTIVIAVLALAACGGKTEQSLRDAVTLLCSSDEEAGLANVAPPDRAAARAKWLDAQITNKEVRQVAENLGNLPPAERAIVLLDLSERAQLKGCDALERGAGGAIGADMMLPVVPVASAGVVPLDDGSGMFTVLARASEIVVEGNALVPLQGGLPGPSELQHGPGGMMMPRLEHYAKQLVQLGGGKLTGARLLFQPDATFKLFLHVVVSIKAAGINRFQLVARRDRVLVAVPFELPTLSTSASADDLARPPPLGVIVALTTSNILVFSLSGVEGTIQNPKLATGGISSDHIARAQAALIDIKSRHSDESKIIVMFDPTINMQLVTETLAAVRATPDGARLFPDVVISAGFE